MKKDHFSKIVEQEIKHVLREFDLSSLSLGHDIQRTDLKEDRLSDPELMKLDRMLREILRRAEKIDSMIVQSSTVYGEGGKNSVEILTTLDDMKCHESVRQKINRVHSYLSDEYPEYDWKFAEEL